MRREERRTRRTMEASACTKTMSRQIRAFGMVCPWCCDWRSVFGRQNESLCVAARPGRDAGVWGRSLLSARSRVTLDWRAGLLVALLLVCLRGPAEVDGYDITKMVEGQWEGGPGGDTELPAPAPAPPTATEETKTGYRIQMVGDLWPLPESEKRQGMPSTIQEAFEEHRGDPDLMANWKSMQAPDQGIHCAGKDDMKRITFRRIQEAVQKNGVAKTFQEWDGIDDTMPDSKLNWKELRMGIKATELYDAFGQRVLISTEEVEMLVRELTDDDSDEFMASNWGSTFYKTDGSSRAGLAQHYAGQPQNLRDGGVDNAMCFDANGKDLDICGFVGRDGFEKAIYQIADMKYSENCNGHGVCDISVGMCHCQPGWTGFNCSSPEKPCGGLIKLESSYGSISDGYGMERSYGHNLNCTWIIQPEHHATYGLPLVITFVFYDMEAGFDTVELYEVPYVDINFKLKALGVGGTLPKERWAMPHSVVIGTGNAIAINFVSDEANPSGSFYGFKALYGRLDSTYIRGLSYPLLAPGCNRAVAAGNPKCLDKTCTNCGVTLDEDADDAVFMGSPENMCFSSFQNSNTTHFNISQDYYMCQEVLQNMWLQHSVGQVIRMQVPCARGFMTPPQGFMYDRPEYILGDGPPEEKFPKPQAGQAFQRGYIPLNVQIPEADGGGIGEWWDSCSLSCRGAKRNEKYDSIFEDSPGKPGPILAAQITAFDSSRASQFKAARVLGPVSRISGLQYGYDQAEDMRTEEEKNSMALKNIFSDIRFLRYTPQSPGVSLELGEEFCEFTFKPTMPGIYRVNFFELRKDLYQDDYVKAVPFPPGMEHRTAVVMPGRTSPANSKALGDGLAYYRTTRTGVGVSFRIESYDKFDNLRLSGGDQYVVALVHEHRDNYEYAAVSNLGNGSYNVVYNVTLSGRYTMHITLPKGIGTDDGGCPNPRRVSLDRPGSTVRSGRQLTGERCDIGLAFTIPTNKTSGKIISRNQTNGSPPIHWCTPVNSVAAKEAGEENCVDYSFQLPDSPWIQFGSPFSVWVDSGPITTDSVSSFGSGLSVAIANYPTFFMLRIRDVFGNWASSLEDVTMVFDVPKVAQDFADGLPSPTAATLHFVGDEVFQGDYAAEWVPVIGGQYKISLMICNPLCNHLHGSPFITEVYEGPTYGPNSTAEGNGILDGFAGHQRTFTIVDRDSANNRRHDGGEDFDVNLLGLSLADCPMVQDQVILDMTRKCPALMENQTIDPCANALGQLLPGGEITQNLLPELTCMYQRNLADCTETCCPDGAADACSEFDHKNTRLGKSSRSTGCAIRTCGFPHDCKNRIKAMLQAKQTSHKDLFQTFLEASHYRCPQIERLGLEAKKLMPPDHRRDGQYNLIISNLDPARPSWKGPMNIYEIQDWIAVNDLPLLYYNRSLNSLGQPFFGLYGDATGNKSAIEGFVDEIASTQGRRMSRTSDSPVSASLHSNSYNMVANFSMTDHDDGSYGILFNVTRAGLYSMHVTHGGLSLEGSPFLFFIRPEVFEAKTCIVNGTGVSKDKNTHTGISDYKGHQVAGKFVAFDISLRDRFWNYLWVSKPESDFKIYLDPMRIRFYDTSIRAESVLYWSSSFIAYTFHDFGDANYKVDYRITTAGNYPLSVRLRSAASGVYEHLDKSPYMIMVRPDKVHIPASTAFGGGLRVCGAGLICTFAVETRDQWGNRRVLDDDEGPYCHTWNANINNGGSGGNQWRQIFPSEGCSAGDQCSSKWIRWANTMPASGYVVDGPEEPQDFPAYNNEIAYHARGGLLHDCVPEAPFTLDAEYNQKPSCVTTRQGPCGRFDEWGRVDKAIWEGEDGELYPWAEYRAKYPERRARFTTFIDGAEPAKYSRFDIFIDPDNMYSGNYNITRGGTFKLSVVWIDPDTGILQHIRGSPFELRVTGGLTDPLQSIADGTGLYSAVVGHPSTFSVYARDRFGNKRSLGREICQVFIQPTNFGSGQIPALVHDRLDGSYYIEYNATISGRYTMSISLLEQDIPGSPFQINVHKGFNFPLFNTSWGLNFAGSAYLQPEIGHVFCWGGDTGCVSQIRLNIEDHDSVGSAWYNTMQRVSNGFETRFSFRIDGLSRHCKTEVVLEDRCMARGGDGFAFVLHDNGFSHALGVGASSMGYGGIDNSIAFEFDTWYNSELGDVYQNHISVHTMGSEKNDPSSRSRLVSSTDVPNLSDGYVHTVKMRYEPWMEADSILDPSYGVSPYSLQWISDGSGTFKIWIDDLDRPVLTFPLNLGKILSLTEGRAYVGFTASTGAAFQNHYIHSWSYVDTVCLNNCNDRGDCIDGHCYCEDLFYGEDCRFVGVQQQQKDYFMCPTQNQMAVSTAAASNCTCPGGHYGPIGGPCDACPVDTWKTAIGDSPCLPCPPNTDSGGMAAVADRAECRCKAGYIGTDGGPCLPVPEDHYKVTVGADERKPTACPANSGTVFRQARSSVHDCLCRPGYEGPNGGPCLVCPTERYKSSWGSATCESECPPFSVTFGCDGPGGNSGCVSSWQCVCEEGYTGQRCLLESPQHKAGKTCPPCVRTAHGPMNTDWDYDPFGKRKILGAEISNNPLYDPYKKKGPIAYTIPYADQREGVGVPQPKQAPAEYGKEGKPVVSTDYT